jgi:hypothetical protein
MSIMDLAGGFFMIRSFRWVEVRNRQSGLRYGPYSRTESAAAQFKELQKDQAGFLQNFYFYPGVRRDKI